jgi:hypothetical protein
MEFIGTEAILDRNRGRDEIPPENKRGKYQKKFDETTRICRDGFDCRVGIECSSVPSDRGRFPELSPEK